MTTAAREKLYFGIDIGSVSLSYVLINQKKQIVKTNYLFHQGNISKINNFELSTDGVLSNSDFYFNLWHCGNLHIDRSPNLLRHGKGQSFLSQSR